MSEAYAANYGYILHVLQERYGDALPSLSILDFGCGKGGLVEYLRSQGLNVVGADPYDDRYGLWQKDKPYLQRIENDTLPFADDHFDIVVSNQVFEHIPDHTKPLSEIHRVLKKGGYFLALFPTIETVYEVHSGVYGAYYLKKFPTVLRYYLQAARLTGAGLWHHKMTPRRWGRMLRDIIVRECHYQTHGKIKKSWRVAFGSEPTLHQGHFLKYRVPKAKILPDAVAGLIATLRAGIVISIVK